MKSITVKFVVPLMLVLALLTTSITGCELKKTEGAPTIPPETSFVMDFDDFNSEGDVTPTSGDVAATVQQASFIFGSDDLCSYQYAAANTQNWNFAAWNVGVWSVIILVGSAVPVAAFVGSFNHTPQQQEDYTWVWSYDVQVGAALYTAELHGKFIDDYNDTTDDGVRWEMYISKQGEYTDFEWYYGESNLPATEGFWILKNKPADPTDLIRIDWERDLAAGTYSIKYTNIVPGGPENGGYISHGATTDETYNRFYEIHNKSANTYIYIEWNSTTKAGRVKASHKFGDEEWHYWDADHYDTIVSA